MTKTLLSALVISDLHAIGLDGIDHQSESLLRYGKSTIRKSPLAALEQLVKSGVRADLLICCGDLTNRAGLDGFQRAWSEIERLADELNAGTLIFTPGNHDLDVVPLHGSDPRVCLKTVVPRPDLRPDPATPHRLADDGFEIYRPVDGVTILNVDSNGRHPTEQKGKRGQIEIETIDAMEAALNDAGVGSICLLLCHHHPFRHGDIDQDDYSEIQGGPDLLEMLNRLPNRPWLILHGHKHHPRILNIDGPRTIFAAGSLSGVFYDTLQCVARNQCYRLELLEDAALGPHHPPVGRFEAWDFMGINWRPAEDGFGIPRRGGFGAVVQPAELAGNIASFVTDHAEQRAPFDEIAEQFPQYRYLTPRDAERTLHELSDIHNVAITMDYFSRELLELGLRR